MSRLYEASVALLKREQKKSGAWYAAPDFSTYHYCWFRDGSFIAHAVDLAGEQENAAAFHDWVVGLLKERIGLMSTVSRIAEEEDRVAEELVLHTRYREDGSPGSSWWENHQLDGLGTWLWAYADHRKRSDSPPLDSKERRVINALADYTASLWRLPCYDLWEEFGDKIHLYTLAAVRAGLIAAQELTGVDRRGAVSDIERFIRDHLTYDGHFRKFVGDRRVDASMLGAIVPFGVASPGAGISQTTVEKIRRDLYRGGGVHRYADDSYYGGGLWLLLAAWLGWYDVLVGRREEAQIIRRWIESKADPDSMTLPEQVQDELIAPAALARWIEKWGKPAHPLLWSHAMYVVLVHALDDDGAL